MRGANEIADSGVTATRSLLRRRLVVVVLWMHGEGARRVGGGDGCDCDAKLTTAPPGGRGVVVDARGRRRRRTARMDCGAAGNLHEIHGKQRKRKRAWVSGGGR